MNPWTPGYSYRNGDSVLGRDGQTYIAKQDTSNIDPVGDSSNTWRNAADPQNPLPPPPEGSYDS